MRDVNIVYLTCFSMSVESRDMKEVQSALHFVKAALNLRDLNSNAWHVYGLVLQALGNPAFRDEIMEAFIVALECRQHCPVRPFASVLQ